MTESDKNPMVNMKNGYDENGLSSPEKDPYFGYRGKPMDVNGNGEHIFGIYRGLNSFGDLVLFPSLAFEHTLVGDETRHYLAWNHEVPSMVDLTKVASVRPVSVASLEAIAIGSRLAAERKAKEAGQGQSQPSNPQ